MIVNGRPTHPADTVADAPDFPAAIRRLEAAYAYEATLIGDPDGYWASKQSEAHEALNIYHEELTEARCRAVARLRETLGQSYAEALEQGDWSRLAF